MAPSLMVVFWLLTFSRATTRGGSWRHSPSLPITSATTTTTSRTKFIPTSCTALTNTNPRLQEDPEANTSHTNNMDNMEDTEADATMSEDAPPLPIQKSTPSTTTTTTSSSSTTKSFLTGKEGVCRIEVARVEWMTTAPWQRTQQSRATGTGFCIWGRQLLTNAHVVKSAVDIRVRKHGSTRRFAARIAVYAPDVDLALLELMGSDEEQDEFFGPTDELALELAEELPALQESVHVVGFPTGGTTICITEGVVSRIDLVSASAFNNLLAIQIDAAINPGQYDAVQYSTLYLFHVPAKFDLL